MDKDIDPLKCQVIGCNARWTVNVGWKKCSKHAWSETTEDTMTFTKKKIFDKPPVRPYTEIDDDGAF